MAKIGFIVSSLYACGGEERVVSLIASELAKYHDIKIYTHENRVNENGIKNTYVLSENIQVEVVPKTKENLFSFVVKTVYLHTGMSKGRVSRYLLKKAYYPVKILEYWISRIEVDKLDVVIGVSGTYAMLLGDIADKVHAKVMSWEHSSYEGYFAPKTGYFRNRELLYKEAASKLGARVVLNEDIAEKFQRNLGLSTTVIYNPKSFVSSQKTDLNQKCFVSCGRLETEKAFDDLVEAFCLASSKCSDWKLLLIGGGSKLESIKKLAEERGIADKLTITGYTNDVKDYLLQGSIFILPSRWEGFGMVVVEAFEVGLPVIAYDIPAMKVLLSQGENGVLVPSFETTKLADAMTKLALDLNERKLLSEKSMKRANDFDISNIVLKWRELLDSMMEDQNA